MKFQLSVLMIFMAGGAYAQDCLVEEAAKAALEQQIELIEATAVNPEEIFGGGVNSCISSDLFNSFDLSNLIIDPAGFLSTSVVSSFNNVLSSAKNKACQAISGKIEDTVGSAVSTVTDYQSSISSDLNSILNNGWDNLL